MYTYIEFPKEKNNEMISILRIGLCIERESDIKTNSSGRVIKLTISHTNNSNNNR